MQGRGQCQDSKVSFITCNVMLVILVLKLVMEVLYCTAQNGFSFFKPPFLEDHWKGFDQTSLEYS